MRTHKANKKKGIALLMAVLTLSVILGVSLTILGAVIKQLNISSAARDSVNAIYSADAGIECALLWDIRGHEFYEPLPGPTGYPVFPTSTASWTDPQSPSPGAGSGLTCFGGLDITNLWVVDDGAVSATTTFEALIPGNTCAQITVVKYDDGTGIFKTYILSRGYNVPCAQIGTNPNAVERAIKVDYIFN